MVADMFFAEIFGILLPEHFIQMFAGVIQLLAARDEDGEICHHHDAFQQRHGAFVQVLPYLIAYKQQFGFGVVHDVVHIVCLELM